MSAADQCSTCGQWVSSGSVICDRCIDGGRFHRSSFCGAGNCVEVFVSTAGALVRDSKKPGDSLWFTPGEWTAFLAGVRNSEFDLPGGAA